MTPTELAQVEEFAADDEENKVRIFLDTATCAVVRQKTAVDCFFTQCKSSAEKPGPKVEKPGSRRSEVSEFLEPTSHSEVYFHGPGLVRPHDLEFYRS